MEKWLQLSTKQTYSTMRNIIHWSDDLVIIYILIVISVVLSFVIFISLPILNVVLFILHTFHT